MKIAITGGKGGTGKSTVATALAVELAKNNKVLLIDADVDCPNDDIILGIDIKKVKDVESMIPKIDKEKCMKCGKCAEVCRESAIVFIKDKHPILIPEQCTGCKACKIACPFGAISESKQIIGEIYQGRNTKNEIDLVSGRLKPGIEESSLVVNDLKKFIKEREKDYDYVLVDTAAGTHCPVIAALLGVEMGIAVTEPTPLGNHDLDLILQLMKELDVKSKIVVNRCDIADEKEIKDTAQKHNVEITAKIPYSKKIQEDYSRGRAIKHPAIKNIIKNLK